MSNNTFSVNYVIYNVNTNETIDRKSMELKVTDKQIRELAKVMENNGGYAPELSEFQNLYEYLIEECINNYQECYAPDDDEFWEKKIPSILKTSFLTSCFKLLRNMSSTKR